MTSKPVGNATHPQAALRDFSEKTKILETGVSGQKGCFVNTKADFWKVDEKTRLLIPC